MKVVSDTMFVSMFVSDTRGCATTLRAWAQAERLTIGELGATVVLSADARRMSTSRTRELDIDPSTLTGSMAADCIRGTQL